MKSMDKKIAQNYIYNVIYRILNVLIPFITTPYLARVLKPEGVGICSYTCAIAALFAMLADLGVIIYGQREVAYHQDDLHNRSIVFFEIGVLRAITTILATVAFCVFSLQYKQYTIILLPQSMSIISGIFDISWYYQGLENFRITALRNIFVRIISVVFIFAFVKTREDILIYIIIISASVLISNLFYFFGIRKYVEKVKCSELHPVKHLKGTWEFFVPMIAVEIYSHLDRIMLGYLIPTNVETGYYEQARKLTTIIVSLIISVNGVMLPRLSKLYAKKEHENMIRFYRSTFRIMLLIMMPACMGLFLISDNFVPWFFGTDYSKVAILLKLSGLLIVFMCVGNFVGMQYLSPTGQQNKMTMTYITAAISNIVLNAILIPHFASIGAMVASIIAEMISCGIQLALLMKSRYRFNALEGCWKYIFATTVMTAGIVFMHYMLGIKGAAGTASDVALGAILYAVTLLVLKEDNIVKVFRGKKLL